MDDTHISSLRPDPRNARLHSPRNIGMIEDALRDVGAARSIVIDEDNVILAGNGVVEAAAAAGIEKLRVIDAGGEEIIAVRRSGLTPEQKQRLALFDNRSAELAMWDPEVVEALSRELDLTDFFYPEELMALLGGDGLATDADTRPQLGELQYRIVVDCRDEDEQAELLARFEGEGLRCKALMS